MVVFVPDNSFSWALQELSSGYKIRDKKIIIHGQVRTLKINLSPLIERRRFAKNPRVGESLFGKVKSSTKRDRYRN